MSITRAIAILSQRWLDGEISTTEHDDRLLAICVWAKRRMFKQIGLI